LAPPSATDSDILAGRCPRVEEGSTSGYSLSLQGDPATDQRWRDGATQAESADIGCAFIDPRKFRALSLRKSACH
jgi:hypothetical protein